MFDMREISIVDFIGDETIGLPRFQRKKTWSNKDNFKLCISLYKSFPIGVVVINKDEDAQQQRLQKWLLDGRQRRNALSEMKNPEKIYEWGKTFCSLNPSDSIEEIIEKFNSKIEEYLDDDVEEDTNKQESIENEDEENIENEDEESIENEDEESMENEDEITNIVITNNAIATGREINFIRGDITKLLEIIKLVHPIRGSQSGLTRPFNFSRYFSNLPFIKSNARNKEIVDAEKLLAWLEYKKQIDRNSYLNLTEDIFYDWLKESGKPERTEQNTRNSIHSRWNNIINVINTLEALKLQLRETKIGCIELTNCSDSDAKKIFEINNSTGTQLKAAEILSAKPSWNVQVPEVSDTIRESIQSLYNRLDIEVPNDVVIWDIAATFADRLQINFIL